jgi:hypothetical protein
MELPAFYLESTVFTTASEMAIVFRSAGCTCLSCPFSSTIISLLRYFLRAITRHGKGKDYWKRAERLY